jgi:hypothetical protein
VTAIFALLLITLIGLSLSTLSQTSVAISSNEREGTEAFYIAESGITHAIGLLAAAGRNNLDGILSAGDGTVNTGDELSTQATNAIPAAGVTFGAGGAGRYVVRVGNDTGEASASSADDTNGRVVVTATGFGRNGAVATISVVVEISGGAAAELPALFVDGNLKINGNPRIQGTGGSVHSNGTLDFDGNPCAALYFSSASNIVDPGNGGSGGGCSYSAGNVRASQPALTPLTYTITDLRPQADYILGVDGKVYLPGAATPIADASGSGKWEPGDGTIWDWDAGGQRWILASTTLGNGTYYSEGNLVISSNPGESGTVPQVTLIAQGYIDISGNPYFTPKLTHEGVPLSMIAGTDLKISGNPAVGRSNFQGRHYAGHQVSFSGNPAIQGQVLAANLADTTSPGGANFVQLSSGYMEISGDPVITYDVSGGGGGAGVGGSGITISWREVRN